MIWVITSCGVISVSAFSSAPYAPFAMQLSMSSGSISPALARTILVCLVKNGSPECEGRSAGGLPVEAWESAMRSAVASSTSR
ncbi:MAG: hypothetical protein QM767_12605 [Anaeromyxobacter sp.]